MDLASNLPTFSHRRIRKTARAPAQPSDRLNRTAPVSLDLGYATAHARHAL
jgi:hypothetical protein